MAGSRGFSIDAMAVTSVLQMRGHLVTEPAAWLAPALGPVLYSRLHCYCFFFAKVVIADSVHVKLGLF